MPETTEIVINTGPIIAIVAALGNLEVLGKLYARVLVPFEVQSEILAGGATGFAVEQFKSSDGLARIPEPLDISLFLRNSLDRGRLP